MKTSPTRQKNIYDLLAPNSYQSLKGVFEKFDIHIDPRILILKNQNKESIISQILNDLASSPKLISFSDPQPQANSQETQEFQSQKKNIQDARIFSFIRCLYLNALCEEAAMKYHKMEELKKIHAELRAFIIKLAESDFQRQARIAEAERDKITQLEQRLISFYEDSYNTTHDFTVNRLSDIHTDIHNINKKLQDLKTEKAEHKKNLKEDSENEAKNLLATVSELKDVDSDVLADLIYNARLEKTKIERKVNKYESKNEHTQMKLQEVEQALNDLEKRAEVLGVKQNIDRHALAGPFIAGKHEKVIRVPESVRMENEDTRNTIEALKDELLAQKAALEGKLEKRNKKSSELKKDTDEILAAAAAKVPDAADIKEILQSEVVKNNLKSILNKQSTFEEKLLQAGAAKVNMKLQREDMVHEAAQIVGAQLYPADKMKAIMQPAPKSTTVAAKEAQIKHLVAGIHAAADELMSAEKKQKKANKQSLGR